jgi:hypothetical protein
VGLHGRDQVLRGERREARSLRTSAASRHSTRQWVCAGGLGFDGKSGAIREETANALKQILGDKAVFDPNKKPVGNLRADDPNRTAVDPN